VKFRLVVLEICERTDRQTDTLIAIPHIHAGGVKLKGAFIEQNHNVNCGDIDEALTAV